MADNSESIRDLTGIKYTHGELVDPTPEALERDAWARERTGVSQVERVMMGLERPADAVRDRELITKALGPMAPKVGPGADLKVPLGSTVGHPTIDERAHDKVTGRATYSSDVYEPGMLHVRVVRSPYPHAKVTNIDTSKAEALPGVHAVLTPTDVPKSGRPALTAEPAFQGEPVVAIAAETLSIAQAAAELVNIEYQQLPFVLDPREALKAGAPLVRSGLKTNAARDPQFSYERGDVTKGFAEADKTVEISVETSFEQHVAMEPHNTVARWDNNVLTLISGNQWSHGIATGVSGELGIPLSNVHVLAHDTGGGFGDKTGRQGYHIVAALLAKKTGRPVRYELNRKDIFLEAGHNYPLYATVKLGVKNDGTITALQGTSYVPSGAYGARSNTDDWEGALHTYKIPNVKVNGFSVNTNTVVTSALRSVGESSGTFMNETLMNRAAEAVNMDPVQFRLKNIETKVDQVTGLPYSSNALKEAIERGAELFGWADRWKGWSKATVGDKPQRGIGMMCFECNKGANSPPMTGIVQIEGDGSVVVNTGASDIGGGQRTTWRMITAEAIGVPLDTITINAMDTEAGPDALGIFGSRGTKSVGTGILHAALDARAKLLDGVSAKWKVPVDDIDIKDGTVFRKSDPGNKDFQMTMRQAAGSGVVVVDQEVRPASGTIVGQARVPAFSGYSQKTFGAGFFEVEVDPATGFVHVTDAVQVHDIGRAINPTGVINQITGGMMQGINKALTEEMIYDPSTGAIVNPDLDEYKLHMIDQLPDKVQVDYMEPFDAVGPFGAKGLGEPALLPPPSGIHAAIYNAVGVQVDHLPMSTPRVLNALQAKT